MFHLPTSLTLRDGESHNILHHSQNSLHVTSGSGRRIRSGCKYDYARHAASERKLSVESRFHRARVADRRPDWRTTFAGRLRPRSRSQRKALNTRRGNCSAARNCNLQHPRNQLFASQSQTHFLARFFGCSGGGEALPLVLVFFIICKSDGFWFWFWPSSRL